MNNLIINSVKDVILEEEEYLRNYVSYGLFQIPENIISEKFVRRIIKKINESHSNGTKIQLRTLQSNCIQNIYFLSGISGINSYSFIFRKTCGYFTILDDIIKLKIQKRKDSRCFYFVLLDQQLNPKEPDQRLNQIKSMDGYEYFNKKISVRVEAEPVKIVTRYIYDIQIEGVLHFFEVL